VMNNTDNALWGFGVGNLFHDPRGNLLHSDAGLFKRGYLSRVALLSTLRNKYLLSEFGILR